MLNGPHTPAHLFSEATLAFCKFCIGVFSGSIAISQKQQKICRLHFAEKVTGSDGPYQLGHLLLLLVLFDPFALVFTLHNSSNTSCKLTVRVVLIPHVPLV